MVTTGGDSPGVAATGALAAAPAFSCGDEYGTEDFPGAEFACCRPRKASRLGGTATAAGGLTAGVVTGMVTGLTTGMVPGTLIFAGDAGTATVPSRIRLASAAPNSTPVRGPAAATPPALSAGATTGPVPTTLDGVFAGAARAVISGMGGIVPFDGGVRD